MEVLELTVHKVAEITGITVRTLHYYDEIDLLVPAKITESGYRMYNEENLQKLQQILFFRELDFQLKEIKMILENPNFDKIDALKKHKELLKLKRNRIDGLIGLIDKKLEGEDNMSFKEFDMKEIKNAQEKYKKEVEERWGHTDAYQESKKKQAKYTERDWADINEAAIEIYKRFVENMDKKVESPEVQELVIQWQNYITKYYYNCTDEILAGLGQMYVADERFTKNIDKYGEGLADFMSKAIEYYCNK